MTDDEQSSVADDAVSNHSDDTAIDEGEAARANGQELSGEEQSAQTLAGEHPAPSVESSDEGEGAEAAEVETAETEAEAEEEQVAVAPKGPIEETPEVEEPIHMDWFILKVQSNRERTIAEALERKMKIEGYERFFDQAIVPTEKVTEFKGGKKKVVERKLYPGYIVVHMHINDDTWFAVRETSGVGDFTGAGGKPTPMLPNEVARIIQTEEEETDEAPKLDIKFAKGDKVKVKEGNFESFEGEVNTIDEASGRVTVMINIFGRSTPVELEYWQIEAV
jgi:transcription termination/antitermination protein NusG